MLVYIIRNLKQQEMKIINKNRRNEIMWNFDDGNK